MPPSLDFFAAGERGRTARAVGAAELAGVGVEAVDLAIGRGAGGVAGAAGLGAGRALAAVGLRRLVARLLAADDAKEAASRRLHHAGLVGHGLGDGEAEGCEGSDRADEHFDGLWIGGKRWWCWVRSSSSIGSARAGVLV